MKRCKRMIEELAGGPLHLQDKLNLWCQKYNLVAEYPTFELDESIELSDEAIDELQALCIRADNTFIGVSYLDVSEYGLEVTGTIIINEVEAVEVFLNPDERYPICIWLPDNEVLIHNNEVTHIKRSTLKHPKLSPLFDTYISVDFEAVVEY